MRSHGTAGTDESAGTDRPTLRSGGLLVEGFCLALERLRLVERADGIRYLV